MASDGSNNCSPRYNAEGPEALGDLRRRNGAPATILKPDLLAKLRLRLDDPPPDGGLWSSRKVAAWMAGELNLTSVAPQRGWEALKAIGWSIQKPRPKNPKSATPEEAAAFKKSARMRCRGGGKAPGQTDRGLRHGRASHWPKAHHPPRVGAPRRASDRGWPSPVRLLYVTAFVSPATGETFWYVSNGVSKEFFEALLETFAREAEAGLSRIILLVLDNAGWHGPANLKIPDGGRLIYLPPYSPEPKRFGRLLTSRSLTSTSRPSQTSTRKSPPSASPSQSSASKSRAELASIGGQSESLRTNQPEMVSQGGACRSIR